MLDRDRTVDLLIQYRREIMVASYFPRSRLRGVQYGEISFGKFYRNLDEIQSAHSARLCFS